MDRSLPVRVTVFGPLHLLALRVHRLVNAGRVHEAIAAADAYLALARAVGDLRTIPFLIQGKMYACLRLGRPHEAAELGGRLLRLHREAGFALGEAKVLCDLAQADLLLSRYVDAMRNLARAGVLLDQPHHDRDRRVSALCSFAEAATAAEMYETAAETYERLGSVTASFRLVHATTLLYWGLRLAHVGRHAEAAARLRRSAAITAGFPGDPGVVAMHALALAKLGETAEAERIVRAVVLPLRTQENYQFARMAHLALGISLRARGDLAGSRTELLAARELCAFGARPDERPIIRFELALTARETDDGQASRDLFETVEGQLRELWRLRQQRVAMLRQARQREEAEIARARAEREILRDPLTGLGNRRRFDLLLDEIDRGLLGAPLTLLLVDVDHFKTINDAYSHSVGDHALREVARILRVHCRSEDIPVRYAGDEFTLFLRGGLDVGLDVAERIRAAIARAEILPGSLPGVRLTVSVGMAALMSGMSGDDLFRRADAQLYTAKFRGRNTVAV